MAESSRLRVQDVRAILRVAGECRELGNDVKAWRGHLIAQLAKLVDADLGFCGVMADCRALRPRDLGVVEWGWENGFDRAVFLTQMARMNADPTYSPATNIYFSRLAQEDGVCHSRPEIIADRDWYRSHDYQSISRAYGVDHILWCFRSLPGSRSDRNAGIVLTRSNGRRDFKPRDLVIVRETQAALTPLVGGMLASFDDPSPSDLPPRLRQVLGYLLEGNSDKQIAARMTLSVHTVNGYTKYIYRYFHVKGRVELLARWIQRGWGAQFHWEDN